MGADNRRNLLYFEASSMRGLHAEMDRWQEENRKRFLAISIQEDQGAFCCIALTNPTEVVICTGDGGGEAEVRCGCIAVFDR